MIILKRILFLLVAIALVGCIQLSVNSGTGGKGPGSGGGACLPWMPASACVGGSGTGGGPALGPVHGQLVNIHGSPGAGVYEIEVASEPWYVPVPPVNLGTPPPACSAATPPVCDEVIITFGSGGKISKKP